MKLSTLANPERYRGLYVYDFGPWSAVGYTAEEVAILLESDEYGDGKVYRIHRALPNGQMELQGVSGQRLRVESGMFFYRRERDAARADFHELARAGDGGDAPCRAVLQLAQRSAAEDGTGVPLLSSSAFPHFVTALIYPGEYDEQVSRWLTSFGYAGGDLVEGGPSHVSNYYEETKTILERRQLWSARSMTRSPEQVLADVRRAVQR